jgi:hypothetical protein
MERHIIVIVIIISASGLQETLQHGIVFFIYSSLVWFLSIYMLSTAFIYYYIHPSYLFLKVTNYWQNNKKESQALLY